MKNKKNVMSQISKDDVKRFARLLKWEKLNEDEQFCYGYLSKARCRYRWLKTKAVNANYQWQMDLADMNKLRGYNHMYRYLLVTINLYSRFAWVKPMKMKLANNTYAKFIAILHDEKYGKRNNMVPKFIQTDLGTEFQQSDGSTSLKENDGRSFPLRIEIWKPRWLNIDWSTQIDDIASHQHVEQRWRRHLHDVLGHGSQVLQPKSPLRVGWGWAPFDVYWKGVVVP